MTIKKTTKLRSVPVGACYFRVPVSLGEPPLIDEEDDETEVDDEEEVDSESADTEDDEQTDDSESAEGDTEDDDADDDEEGDAESAEDDDEGDEAKAGDGRKFVVVANSGKPMRDVPWWGTLGIDLKGIKAKARVPALLDHDVSKRIGVFEKSKLTGDGLVMSGRFLANSMLANQVNTELRDGFPFEASVRLHPLKIEELAAGEESEVNGHRIVGPAQIFRSSELRETSLVALGQDQHTSAAALSDSAPQVQVAFETAAAEPDEKMTKTKTKTVGTDAAAAAVTEERTRIASLRKAAIPEQADLLAKMIDDGTPLSEGIAALHADLQGRFEGQRQQMASNSDTSLSTGNSDDATKAAVAKLSALPDSEEKFRKLWKIDASLHETYHSEDAYIGDMLHQARL